MNAMINSEMDNKNIGLLKNLWRLRQTLDVHCLISMNAAAINRGVGKSFFTFLEMSCQHLMALYICRVFEEEVPVSGGKVRYELDSIGGVLRAMDGGKASVLDSDRIGGFVEKYGTDSDECGLAAISTVIKEFRQQHHEALSGCKTLRDKWIAHGESGFTAKGAPSYGLMERLFNFGLDFYMLVSQAVGVGPVDLNRDRKVRTSLKRTLEKLGCEDVRTEMT